MRRMTQKERCELLYEKIRRYQVKEGKVKMTIVDNGFGAQLTSINHESFVVECIDKLMAPSGKLTPADMVILNKLYEQYKKY